MIVVCLPVGSEEQFPLNACIQLGYGVSLLLSHVVSPRYVVLQLEELPQSFSSLRRFF